MAAPGGLERGGKDAEGFGVRRRGRYRASAFDRPEPASQPPTPHCRLSGPPPQTREPFKVAC